MKQGRRLNASWLFASHLATRLDLSQAQNKEDASARGPSAARFNGCRQCRRPPKETIEGKRHQEVRASAGAGATLISESVGVCHTG